MAKVTKKSKTEKNHQDLAAKEAAPPKAEPLIVVKEGAPPKIVQAIQFREAIPPKVVPAIPVKALKPPPTVSQQVTSPPIIKSFFHSPYNYAELSPLNQKPSK